MIIKCVLTPFYGAHTGTIVADMFERLSAKSSSIYIERSRRIYSENLNRTELISFELKRLHLAAYADSSMSGVETIIDHMRSIDPLR